MKRIKKLASLLLAMVMVLGMTMTTFAAQTADPGYDLTIKTVAKHTYKIWQLATGDVASGETQLSNVKPGSNAASTTTPEMIEALGEKDADGNFLFGDDTLGDAALALLDTKTTTPFKTIEGDGSSKTEKLPGGYYVITDSYTHEHTAECYDAEGNLTCTINNVEGDSVSRTMVYLVQDQVVAPKTITVEPDKKIKEDDTGKESNEASIGDVITYQLSGTIPAMTGYNNFKYVLVDTASKGLSQNLKKGDILTGGIGEKDPDTKLVKPLDPAVPVTYEVMSDPVKNPDGTSVVRIAVQNAIQYDNEAYVGKWFYVDIDATLTADADVVAIPNTNKVVIDFSNNPNHKYDGTPDFGPEDPKGTTVDKTVETFTTSLTLTKVDKDTNAVLTGAEFKLESTNNANVGYVTGQEYVADENGTWYKLVDGAYTETAPTDDTANKYASTTQKYKLVTVDKTTYTGAQTETQAFVDANGKVVFTGLGVGDFKLTEVTTPDGYNTLEPIEFSVTWTKDGGFKVTLAEGTPEGISISDENGLLASTIPNSKGSLLPSTGGIGTTIFYVVGAVLAIGAGILLVTKKRMSAR